MQAPPTREALDDALLLIKVQKRTYMVTKQSTKQSMTSQTALLNPILAL